LTTEVRSMAYTQRDNGKRISRIEDRLFIIPRVLDDSKRDKEPQPREHQEDSR